MFFVFFYMCLVISFSAHSADSAACLKILDEGDSSSHYRISVVRNVPVPYYTVSREFPVHEIDRSYDVRSVQGFTSFCHVFAQIFSGECKRLYSRFISPLYETRSFSRPFHTNELL